VARRGSSLVVGGPGDEPLLLAGPPRHLTGRIDVHNHGEASVVLRDAGLRDPSGTLQLQPARHKLAPIVLRPDQGGSVPLSLAVDPATPPGVHDAELDLAGGTRSVQLHVAEVVDLAVLPRSLVVANRPGVAQRKQLTVANEGNVAFAIGDPGTVPLFDELRRSQVRRLLIEPLLDRKRPDVEALVVSLLAVVREDEETAPRLEVRIAGGPAELAPGETRLVELEITLQEGLPARGRYAGRIPVLTRDVDVVVVTSGGPVQATTPEAAPRRARRSPADAGKPARRAGGTTPARRGGRS
jgi:hypothetical protein